MELIFLGTGTSQGVPIIGCECEVCCSDDPRDRRTRPSAALRLDDGRILLIDTTPELRLQALAAGIRRVDAALFTHHHADHIMGMDDLRAFNQLNGNVIDCHGRPETIENLRRVFHYAEVTDGRERHPDRPGVRLREIDGPFELMGLRITPVELPHARLTVLGFRFDWPGGSLAYCTDQSAMPDAAAAALAGVDLLVLGALRHRPHRAHMTLAESVATAEGINAARTFFTHMNHDLPHTATNADLPPDKQLAHDGLVVEV
jgi:phosphoribosyl 1,2-cyclic phosphate phosphodiesterase